MKNVDMMVKLSISKTTGWAGRAGLGAAVLMIVGLPRPGLAQKYTPPPPPLTTKPCVPTKKDPCTQPDVTPKTPAAAEQNPFPGEPGTGTVPTSEGKPGQVTPADASQANPFPGEPAGTPVPSSSAESSSSSSSSDAPVLPDTDGDDTTAKDAGRTTNRFARKHLPKVEDKDNREEQDIQISRYYASAGNYKAAYLRAKDAVATVPTDPEAHLVLAESAQKMQNFFEARTEYNAYLHMEPDGEHAKAARKALDGLPQPK